MELHPIGTLRTPHVRRKGTPIQPSRAAGVAGRAELGPELAAGLEDLDGFSHVVLIYHFHRSEGFDLKVVPFLDDVPRGVFATRAPRRPNPLGVSVVRLLRIEGATLHFDGADMLDGTPLLDIKPYVPEFTDPTAVRTGWLEAARRRERDGRAGDR